MIGIIVAAHGPLAPALVNTAKLVVPQAEAVVSVSVDPGDSSEQFDAKLNEAIAQLKSTDGVLVMTDMFVGAKPGQHDQAQYGSGGSHYGYQPPHADQGASNEHLGG